MGFSVDDRVFWPRKSKTIVFIVVEHQSYYEAEDDDGALQKYPQDVYLVKDLFGDLHSVDASELVFFYGGNMQLVDFPTVGDQDGNIYTIVNKTQIPYGAGYILVYHFERVIGANITAEQADTVRIGLMDIINVNYIIREANAGSIVIICI